MKKSLTSNLTPIASGVAVLIMSVAMSAQAQQVAPETQEIVVTGIRASMQQSINQQRNSDSHIEVITAEDVGKMADKNVADSLQRIPGVNVQAAGGSEGSFGENDRISLRGTPSALTLTTLNGHSVSSGDWFSDNIISGGRSVSFSLFPSELIGRVTVHKGSEASLVDGGAMGVVDIETRKPLDMLRGKKTYTGQISLGAINTSNSGKTDPQVNGLLAWKNDESTFGILVQAFNEKRTLSRVAQENSIWYDRIDTGSPIANAIPGSAGGVVNYLGGTAWFEQVRTRKGALVDLQFKPSKDLTFDVTAFHSHMDAPNINHNFMQTMGRFLGNSWAAPSFPAANITGAVSNNVITSISATVPSNCVPCSGMSGSIQEIFGRPVAESQSKFVNLDGKFKVSDAFTLSGKFGTTEGLGNTESGALSNPIPFTAISYVNHGPTQPVTYTTAGSNVHSIGGGYGGVPGTFGSHVTSNDKESYAQLDGEYKLDLPVLHTLKFGVRVADHKRDLSVIDLSALPGMDDPKNLPLYGLTTFPSNLSDVSGVGANYWTFSQAAVNAWAKKYTKFDTERTQSEFHIKEPTKSAYLQGDFGTDTGLSGNFGVRFATTKEDVTVYQANGAGGFSPVNSVKTYNDVLPSANLRYDLSKDVVTRLGISRTMARPELGAMAGIDLRDQQLTGTTGNPNLAPIRSNNLDVGAEWYFAPRSVLGADLFYAKLDGYVSYGASSGTYYNNQTKKNELYKTSSPINSTADVKGLELSYTQALGGGFGVNANYTYTDAKETGAKLGSACGALISPDCTMIGASKSAYNLGAFYEDDRFSARIAYSYRSAFLNGFSRNTAQFQAEIGTVSATMSYKINDNFSVSLDGKDLNNPMNRSEIHNVGAANLPGSFYKNGRQVFLSLNAKM